MAQVAIPAAIMAGSAIVKKLRKPAALTPQGTQAQGNLLGNAGSLRDAGNSLLGSGAALQKTGMGAFNKANADLNIPMNYYRTIAGGSRGAMTAAMAPEMGAITSAYRGAESALDRGPARGALRDVAGADIAREKAGKISGLALNARGGAMSSLAGLAAQQQGAGRDHLARRPVKRVGVEHGQIHRPEHFAEVAGIRDEGIGEAGADRQTAQRNAPKGPGLGLRTGQGRGDHAAAVADRYLHRRVALRPGHFRQPPLQVRRVGHSHAGRYSEQERQSHAERAAAARRAA